MGRLMEPRQQDQELILHPDKHVPQSEHHWISYIQPNCCNNIKNISCTSDTPHPCIPSSLEAARIFQQSAPTNRNPCDHLPSVTFSEAISAPFMTPFHHKSELLMLFSPCPFIPNPVNILTRYYSFGKVSVNTIRPDITRSDGGPSKISSTSRGCR